MKNILLIIIFSLYFEAAYSQPSNCIGLSDDDYRNRMEYGLIGFEYVNPAKGYAGEQYFNNWTLGEISFDNGDVIRNITLRYDEFMDQLLWLRKIDFRTGIICKQGITGFKLFNAQNKNETLAAFTKLKIEVVGADSIGAYLQQLVLGEISLYVYRNKNIISTNENKLNDNTHYLLISGGTQYSLSLSRHSLLNIPVIQKSEMKAILRSGGIVLYKNEQGLVNAISRYNEKHKK